MPSIESKQDDAENQRAHFLGGRLRNRISGAVAFLFGFFMLALLIYEGRWDNHDTVRPIKALLGSIFFIAGGLWYFLKGEKAEPWRGKKVESLQKHISKNTTDSTHSAMKIPDKIIQSAEFQNECKKIEKEMRENAQTIEATRAGSN